MSFDFEQVQAFARTLERKANAIPSQVRPVVSKGALNIKTAWAKDTRRAGTPGFRQIGASITYDMQAGFSGGSLAVQAEIGPDKSIGAGPLANVYIFGTSRGGGTGTNPEKFLREEMPEFEKHLGDLGEDIA